MSGKLQLEPLFKGGTTAGGLKTLRMFLSEQGEFDRYVVPCVGNFTVPETLAECGVNPEQIQTGDITLYSSVLGYVCDPTRSVHDLEFQIVSPELNEVLKQVTGDESHQIWAGARILFALKWAQMQSDKEYMKWRRREMESQATAVFASYATALRRLKDKLSGLQYYPIDCHAQIDAAEAGAQSDVRVFIWYNPPGYGGGYTKMFDPKGAFTWKVPDIPELKPKDVGPKIAEMAGFQSTVCVFATEGHALQDSPEGAWTQLYSELNAKTMKRTFVLSNRDSKVAVLNRRKFRQIPANPPPVYDDHEITADSTFSFVKSDMDTVLYFYDLFARELGMVKAEVYYLFCVDGQVAGAMGFDVRTYMTTRAPKLYETFGLNGTFKRHARIGRLLMAGMCCREFIDQFKREHVPESLLLPDIEEIQTTCLTKYPEAKKNRGILKLMSREKMANGRFHLVYRTPVHEHGFKEVLEAWLKKHAQYGRQ